MRHEIRIAITSDPSKIASQATQAQYALSSPNGSTIHTDQGGVRSISGLSAGYP